MPSTVNGIGSHYYGKQNETTRKAVCNHCHNMATMTSYDTRLWCVFLFIPVIPLGRKRVIDMCDACSYHYAQKAGEYETGRLQALARATEQLRSEGTVNAGLEMHATLLAYREMEEADELRGTLIKQYPDNVKLLTGIANHLKEIGLAKEARQTWNKLHKLDPELPEPRYWLSFDKMSRGRLDEARELLRFLEAPGSETHYNYDALLSLAELYQQKDRHDEVLEITNLVAERFPEYATNHRFRRLVRKSENNAKTTVSSAPRVQHSASKLFSDQYSTGFRWFIGLGIATIVGLLGMVVNNYYISAHRAITIINGTGIPAMVQVNDQDPVQVIKKAAVTVAEGHHRVKVTGPLEETYEVNVASTGYFSRWSSSPMWLVNVGGEAILTRWKHFYALNPPPSEGEVVLGTVIIADDIDYQFTDLPKELEVTGDQTRVLTSIEFRTCGNSEPAEVAFFKKISEFDHAAGMTFAKRRLGRSSEKTNLLTEVLSYANPDDADHLVPFIDKEIENQGGAVNIVWHRARQDLISLNDGIHSVMEEYKQKLQSNPENPGLIYLYARTIPDSVESAQLFNQAIELGDESGFAQFAIAYRHNTMGQWQQAGEAIERASGKSVPGKLLDQQMVPAQFGLREFSELESKLSVENKNGMDGLANALQYAAVQAMKPDPKLGLNDELFRPLYKVLNEAGVKRDSPDWKLWTRILWSSVGELKERIEVDENTSEILLSLAINQRIETGELDHAQALAEKHFPGNYSFLLRLAIERQSRGEQEQGESLLQKSVELLKQKKRYDGRLLAALQDRPVTSDSIHNINMLEMDPFNKPELFLVLAAFADSNEVRQQAQQRAKHFMIKKSASWSFFQRHLGNK